MTRRNRAPRLAILAGSLALSACASLPPVDEAPYKRIVPATWKAGAQDAATVPAAEPPARWWQVFGDPLLDAAIGEAVGTNDAVWQAQARAAQARASAVIAGADRLPAIGAGLGVERTRRSIGDLDARTSGTYGVNLNIDWELDLWGKLAAQSAAGRETYLASTEALRAVRQSVAAQTAKAYFATVESRQQVALSRRTVEVMTETARQVGNRADVGVGSPGDKFLAISNREKAAAGLAGATEIEERTARQLQLLQSDYPDGAVTVAQTIAPVPALPATGLPASLLARRPDILAARNQLQAAGFKVFAAEKSLLPAINLSSGLGFASTQLSQLLSGNFTMWTLAGNLLQPLFLGGKLRANVELNQAAQAEAAAKYAQTVLTALAEVETALDVRADIAERITRLCAAANAAEAAEQISFNRYSQGVEPFLTVLQSQQRALDISSSCLASRRAGLDNHIDLMLALGGGFDATPLPPETVATRLHKRFDGAYEQPVTEAIQ